MPPDTYPLLGTVAVQASVLSESELDEVLQKAAERGVPLGEMLFKLGYVSRDRLLELLAEQYRTTVYDLAEWRSDPTLLEVLPGAFAREYQLLPVRLSNGHLVLGAAGPFRTPLDDLLAHVAELTGYRAEVVICEPEALRRYIAEFYAEAEGAAGAEAEAAADDVPDFSSLVREIREEAGDAAPSDAAIGAELDETLDRAFTALMEVRAHPFLNTVAANTNSAAELLDKAKQYQHMGMHSEGLTLARRADGQLAAALRKAGEIQQAWGPLLQHVELLRTRCTQLETENAMDFAPQEMGRLREIREAMHDGIEAKHVESLRALVDEGQLLVERVAALSPRHNRRERLIESLNHVREVLARARRLGAQTVAPGAVDAAYRLLDDADARARENAWDLVQDALAQALAHAQAAEEQALEYAETRKLQQAALRELCSSVDAGVGELASHAAAHAILVPLQHALHDLSAARLALDADTGEDLAQHTAALTALRDTTLPVLRQEADDAHAGWADLGWAVEAAAATVRDGAQANLTGERAEAAARCAEDLLAFFRALNDRNLSTAKTVVQETEQRLRDFWDVSGREREERRPLEARLAEVTSRLGVVAARLPTPAMQEFVQPLHTDLAAAGTALVQADLGAAAALLDTVEQALDGKLLPAIDRVQSQRGIALDRTRALLTTLGDLAAREAAQLTPEAYRALLGAAEQAVQATVEGDADASEAALADADAAEQAVRAALEGGMTARAEALARRLADLDGRVQAALQDATGQGTPELLEEAYYELNSARAILEEQAEGVPTETAGRIESHLRAAEVMVQQISSIGTLDRRRLDGALDYLKSEGAALEGELDELLAQPDLGLDHPVLQEAADTLAEITAAHGERDLARACDLVRQAERALEHVRVQRRHTGQRREDLDLFFETTLPDHLAALDGAVLRDVAPDAWAQLETVPGAAAEARDVNDLNTLADLHRQALQLLAECAAATRRERSRRLVAVQQAQAEAHSALRLAGLVEAADRSPDLYAAAAQLLAAGEGAARALAWEEAQTHFHAAAARAAEAQEAALLAARNAHAAQADLVHAAAHHLARGEVDAAHTALDAATTALGRARPPEPSGEDAAGVPDPDAENTDASRES